MPRPLWEHERHIFVSPDHRPVVVDGGHPTAPMPIAGVVLRSVGRIVDGIVLHRNALIIAVQQTLQAMIAQTRGDAPHTSKPKSLSSWCVFFASSAVEVVFVAVSRCAERGTLVFNGAIKERAPSRRAERWRRRLLRSRILIERRNAATAVPASFPQKGALRLAKAGRQKAR